MASKGLASATDAAVVWGTPYGGLNTRAEAGGPPAVVECHIPLEHVGTKALQ